MGPRRAASARSSRFFGIEPTSSKRSTSSEGRPTRSATRSGTRVKANYEEKEQLVGAELMRRLERDIMLQIVDAQWKDHLYSLDHLKEGIGLRGYGQRDPLVEYKKESFALFQDMKARIEEEMVRYLFWLRPVLQDGAAIGAAVRAAAPAPRRSRRRCLEQSGAEPVAGVRRRAAHGAAAAAEPTSGGRGAPQPARVGGDECRQDRPARRAEGRPQRSVPVRQRQEIQEVPRGSRVTEASADDMSASVCA